MGLASRRTGLAAVGITALPVLVALACGSGATQAPAGTNLGAGDGGVTGTDGGAPVVGGTTDGGSTGGTMQGLWRATTASGTRTAGLSQTQASFSIPLAAPWPLLATDAETLIEINGTTLQEYIWLHGMSVHYRSSQALFDLGGTVSAADTRAGTILSRRGTVFRTFEPRDGRLLVTIYQTEALNPANLGVVILEVTHDRYTGSVPPAGWPTPFLPLE